MFRAGYLKAVFAVMCSLLINACTVANYVVPAYTTLEFEVSHDVNPDLNGRASPVVVKVFEISSKTIFETQDFFSLYDEPEGYLGPDLIISSEFELAPNSKYEHELTLAPGVRYAGILVAYRDIENARWRELIEIDKSDYRTVKVNVGGLAVFAN
ncbi:type VI secretion system-associated lipoprotein [Photobacterium proteolyticum]|uniref:Type VI secretion system-associated lipoprotein n=1 Tax=Photobacterium proteolyticum TaxID=1903952 RepID=A0A1Q9G6U1_9GAMM|nr:type VI secretion system lipoprotein TssJ [Photobacterium proteolyticum]OLQ69949.1 type VI secretion system-associated lipoprotein [Photobacterium proteolyticum]